MKLTARKLFWGGVAGILLVSALTSWFEVYVYESWWSRILGDVLTAPFLGMALVGLYLRYREKEELEDGRDRDPEGR